jgi:cation diffusion facilitator CzcD-associated flavoprotein CzcO
MRNVCQAKSVCVIGAGASGLISGRVLQLAGFNVDILEAASCVGGVWKYRADGGPVYKSLVTNLPKQIMQASPDHPFPKHADPLQSSYATHAEVQEYLEAFASSEGLLPQIKLSRRVLKVEPTPSGRWRVSSNSPTACTSPSSSSASEVDSSASSVVESEYDFVAVCNGHYNLPISPQMPGMQDFLKNGGRSVHAMEYDSHWADSESVRGKSVCVVGKP